MEPTPGEIREMVQMRFARIAKDPSLETKFPVGRESALRLGYKAVELDPLPAGVVESFSGVGNPLSLGSVEGMDVLDIGCGTGMDSLLAAKVARSVIGVDMTPEMLEKALRFKADNVEYRKGHTNLLPVQDASVDVVLSNGVLNLCHDKPRAAAELFRVLRSGGRLQLADIIVEEGVTIEEVRKIGTWSD